MHEDTAPGWPSWSPGPGLLQESKKAIYSSAKRDEEGLLAGRQSPWGKGQVRERKRRGKVHPGKDLREQTEGWKEETGEDSGERGKKG